MDGKNRTVIHDTDLERPNGLTLEYTQQTLYWIDTNQNRIESSTVDGSNRRLISSDRTGSPFGITLYRDILYFTEREEVKTVPSSGGIVKIIIDNFCAKAFGIVVVSAERQPAGTCIQWRVCII